MSALVARRPRLHRRAGPRWWSTPTARRSPASPTSPAATACRSPSPRCRPPPPPTPSAPASSERHRRRAARRACMTKEKQFGPKAAGPGDAARGARPRAHRACEDELDARPAAGRPRRTYGDIAARVVSREMAATSPIRRSWSAAFDAALTTGFGAAQGRRRDRRRGCASSTGAQAELNLQLEDVRRGDAPSRPYTRGGAGELPRGQDRRAGAHLPGRRRRAGRRPTRRAPTRAPARSSSSTCATVHAGHRRGLEGRGAGALHRGADAERHAARAAEAAWSRLRARRRRRRCWCAATSTSSSARTGDASGDRARPGRRSVGQEPGAVGAARGAREGRGARRRRAGAALRRPHQLKAAFELRAMPKLHAGGVPRRRAHQHRRLAAARRARRRLPRHRPRRPLRPGARAQGGRLHPHLRPRGLGAGEAHGRRGAQARHRPLRRQQALHLRLPLRARQLRQGAGGAACSRTTSRSPSSTTSACRSRRRPPAASSWARPTAS